MDYTIFRQNTNDFMRYTDGIIPIYNEKEDAENEFALEQSEGTNPLVIVIDYSERFFDSEGNYKQMATMHKGNENGEIVGMITYSLADDSCFDKAFNDWTEEFISREY